MRIGLQQIIVQIVARQFVRKLRVLATRHASIDKSGM